MGSTSIKPHYKKDIPSVEDENTKTYFPDSLQGEETSSLWPIALMLPRNSIRMQAQLGVFTISHREKTPIEKIGDETHIWKYDIPKENKKDIQTELKRLAFGKFQLFPELHIIGEQIKGEI